MKTATVTAFRTNIKALLAEVESEQDILILSGPKKKGFVLLTLQQFNAMQETAHLLSTPANTAHLMGSIAQHKTGKVIMKELALVRAEETKEIKSRSVKRQPSKKAIHQGSLK